MSYLSRAARRVLPQVAGLRQMSGATGVKKNFYVEVRRLCVRESCVARRVRSRRSRSKSLPRNTVPWLRSHPPPSLSLSSTRPQEWDGVRGDVYKEWTFAPKNVASAFFFLIVIPGAIFATATSQQHVRSLSHCALCLCCYTPSSHLPSPLPASAPFDRAHTSFVADYGHDDLIAGENLRTKRRQAAIE